MSVDDAVRTPTRGVIELRRRRALADSIGGSEAVERQHGRGLLTAQERIDLLLDPGSHVHFGRLVHSDDFADYERTFGDGELCGFGTVGGRAVAYTASDPRVKGASGTPATFRHSEFFRSIIEKSALPLVYLMQGGGARMTDAMSSRFLSFPGTGLGARRAVPRRGAWLVAVMGAYYAPWNVAQSDFAVMTQASNISLTSPPLVEVGLGQRVTAAELGGAAVQARISGQIDSVVADDVAAIDAIRRVFGYLPSHAGATPPVGDTSDPVDRPTPELAGIVPPNLAAAYDVRRVIEVVADRGSFIEWSPSFAPNMVTGLARIGGNTVAVMANQPQALAGTINGASLTKATRILTLAEDFSLPLINLLDVPGVLPSKEEEHARLMTRLYDFAVQRVRADIPKVSVVLRKGIGFALQAMSAGDPEGFTFAWPDSQIAFTGIEAAVRVTYRRELEASTDLRASISELGAGFEGQAAPWPAARMAYLDDVIEPAQTRSKIARALQIGSRTRGRPFPYG